MTNGGAANEPWQMVMEALARIERRLDGFVTIAAHTADIRRIDERIADLVSDLGLERAQRAEDRAEITAQVVELRKALEAEANARRKGDEGDLNTVRAEIKTEAADRKRDRQWLITAIVMVLGVVVAVAKVLWPT